MFGYPFRPPGTTPRHRPSVRVLSETFPQPPSRSLPNESVLAPGREENRPCHPLFRPSSPPPPAAPRLRPNPAAPAPPLEVPPPNCYAATDPGIFWLNKRPYWLRRLLGKGGSGEVHEVEMLLPRGLEVVWDDKGDMSFDEDGRVALTRSDEDSAEVGSELVARGREDRNEIQQPSSEVLPQAEVPSLVLPMSMTTSESMRFSSIRRHEALNGGSLSGAGLGVSSEGEDHAPGMDVTTKDETSVHDNFPAGSGSFVQRSGIFFALKVQSACDEKHLDCLVKEVANMRLLLGEAGIVQLRDHAVDRKSLYLFILMDLGACDLHAFLNRNRYCLDMPSIARVWSILVHRVETLHSFDVIHRDIKPHNFILVPTEGHRSSGILARMSRGDFVLRLVQRDQEVPTRKECGDVELVIKDPTTNKEEVLLLSIKLTDFGIARSVDADASHLSLSLPGPNGTVIFMAPEVVRQTITGCRTVSKRVDIWALGVMLYQMLHAGKSPFLPYLINGGPREALLAIASETVNREAMDFDASTLWRTERTRLLRSLGAGGDHGGVVDPSQDLPTMTTEMVRTLVVSWVGLELLVRVCKRCLVFDVNDRIDGADLRMWIDGAIEARWGSREVDGGVISQSELLQAAFNIDANGMMQTVDSEIARIGERVGAALFPGIWMPSLSVVQAGVSGNGSSPSAKVNDKHDPEARPSALPPSYSSESIDSFQDRPRRRSFLETLMLIVVSLAVGAGLCAVIVVAIRGSWSGMGGGKDIEPSSNDGEGAPQSPSFLELSSPDWVASGDGGAPGGGGGRGIAGGSGGDASPGPSVVGLSPSACSPGLFPSPSPGPFPGPSPASHPPHVLPPRDRDPVISAHDPVQHGPTPRDSTPTPTSPHGPASSSRDGDLAPPHGSAPALSLTSASALSKYANASPEPAPAGPDKDLRARPWDRSCSPRCIADRGAVLKALAENGLALQHASEGLRADRDVVLKALAENGLALEYASADLRADRLTVLKALAENGLALEYASADLRADRLTVLKALAENGLALEYASADLRADRLTVLKAVVEDGRALQFASKDFRVDRDIVLAAVAQAGRALKHACEGLRADREVVLKAVAQDGRALQFASEDLRADKEMIALRQLTHDRVVAVPHGPTSHDPASPHSPAPRSPSPSPPLRSPYHRGLLADPREALKYFPGGLPADRESVFAAVARNGMALEWAPSKFRADKEIVLKAFRKDGCLLEHASEDLRANKEVVLEALAQNGLALRHASEGLRADREVVLKAVAEYGPALTYASADLRNDREIVLKALADGDGRALAYASANLRADREVVLEALANILLADRETVLAAVKTKRGRPALQHASEDLLDDQEVILAASMISWSHSNMIPWSLPT